jgi:hypothetical protein
VLAIISVIPLLAVNENQLRKTEVGKSVSYREPPATGFIEKNLVIEHNRIWCVKGVSTS